jgi:MFS family permease
MGMQTERRQGNAAQVVAIGLAQMVAWASSTYLPAILAAPMAAAYGIGTSWVFGAFSCALGVMGLLGPAIGRAIDRRGGRRLMCLSSGVLAGGLLVLSLAPTLPLMFAGWTLIGIGMALGLYDAAFAALVRQHGLAARGPITGITLLGGFASTLGWPLTAWLVAHRDWRLACQFWAAANLLLALPLYWFFLPTLAEQAGEPAPNSTDAMPLVRLPGRRSLLLLVIFGAGVAIGAAALVGPAQVAARLGEFLLALGALFMLRGTDR